MKTMRRTRKTAPKMHETQAAYALALAAYETANAAHVAEVRAAGWWERGDDESLDLIEDSAERHGTSKLFSLLRDAERAMVKWSLENARKMATTEQAAELANLDVRAELHPDIWKRIVDVAFSAAA